MSEKLIYAAALREEMNEYILPLTTNNLMGAADVFHRTAHLLDEAPAVDAVEVVRCGKCVYRHKFMQDIYYCTKDGFFNDNLPNRIVKETDFCSFGERREENAVD